MGSEGFEPSTNGYLRPFAHEYRLLFLSSWIKAFSAYGLKASAVFTSAALTMLSYEPSDYLLSNYYLNCFQYKTLKASCSLQSMCLPCVLSDFCRSSVTARRTIFFILPVRCSSASPAAYVGNLPFLAHRWRSFCHQNLLVFNL